LMQTVAPARFIELATNGLEYVPEPYTRSVLLVPSFVMRPYICDTEYQNVELLIYPVADESLLEDKTSPPSRLVRLYKALADERRLRILKMLAERSYSLQELAEKFGVAKTTMHHHMIILRSASLIRLRTSDHRYSLRDEMIGDVAELLQAYLKRI
jgi:DNA-binding transcriptional ArsR family regulator